MTADDGPRTAARRVERRGYEDPVLQEMLAEYMDELYHLVPSFDPDLASPPSPEDFVWPSGSFLVVMDGEEAIGCGAVRRIAERRGELRRMWVRPAWRGQGIGRALLSALEDLARQMDLAELYLDTSGELGAALGLYRSCGYEDVAPYNANRFADFWLAKRL